MHITHPHHPSHLLPPKHPKKTSFIIHYTHANKLDTVGYSACYYLQRKLEEARMCGIHSVVDARIANRSHPNPILALTSRLVRSALGAQMVQSRILTMALTRLTFPSYLWSRQVTGHRFLTCYGRSWMDANRNTKRRHQKPGANTLSAYSNTLASNPGSSHPILFVGIRRT